MSDKLSTSKNRQWVAAILALGLIALCILSYYWVTYWVKDLLNSSTSDAETVNIYQPVPTNMADISMLEGNADMKFPLSTSEIYGYVTGFREVDTDVRFSMKASELAAFIETTLCKTPLENITPTAEQKEQELKSSLLWWRAYQAKTLQRCSGEKKSSHQIIFVDMSDPETYIIYISDSGI